MATSQLECPSGQSGRETNYCPRRLDCDQSGAISGDKWLILRPIRHTHGHSARLNVSGDTSGGLGARFCRFGMLVSSRGVCLYGSRLPRGGGVWQQSKQSERVRFKRWRMRQQPFGDRQARNHKHRHKLKEANNDGQLGRLTSQ